MKTYKYITLFVVITACFVLPIQVYSFTNYIKEGTEWKIIFVSYDMGPETPNFSHKIEKIEGMRHIGEKEWLDVWTSYDSSKFNFTCSILYENEKVYILNPDDIKEIEQGKQVQPRLLYDFSLTKDESSIVSLSDKSQDVLVKVSDFSIVQTINNKFQTIIMTQLTEFNNSDDNNLPKFEWIKGIGSEFGFVENTIDFIPDDSTSILSEVIYGGETVFRNPQFTGIEVISDKSEKNSDRTYNMQGKLIDPVSYKGIIIKNGKKIINR